MEVSLFLVGIFCLFFIFYFIKNAKKHLFLKALEFVFISACLILAILYLSQHTDINNVLSKGKNIMATGASIIETIKNSIG